MLCRYLDTLKMRRVSLFVFLLMNTVPAVLAAELLPLQHHPDLWSTIEKDLQRPASTSLLRAPFLNDANEVSNYHALHWELVKTSGGTLRFKHYDTFYQGYPVLNGRIVLAVNRQGQLQQMMGSLATELSADLPNAKAAFTQDNKALRRWVYASVESKQVINDLEFSPAVYIDASLAKAAYRINYRLENKEGITIARPYLIVDGQSLEIIKQWDGLDQLQQPSMVAISGDLVMAGGAGGNELLGLNCYSPEPSSMSQCLGYVGEDVPVGEEPIITEVSFQNLDVNNIFSAFSGYPFIVTKNGSDCWLKNDYVTTIKYEKISPSNSAFQYSCDGSTEHFDLFSIDDNYYDFLSYFPINDAHFYAGIVMQMYDQYLRDIYPDQAEDCPADQENSDYCLKPISQRANAKGPTGADIANANWDGEYVNYGNGSIWEMFSQTTIDLVAHEISHAVTEWNSDPERAGQSQALDESFSDIAAIAANDFFERHVSGSYASSVPYMNKRESQWRYGWDVFVLPGGGGRDFKLPSLDGRSIDDAREYRQGTSAHSAGGVMNKLFYELVSRQGWSIEDTFKLMLEANVSCWTTQIDFEAAGDCLLLLTPNINKQRQLDETLHSVGIFSSQSTIVALPFNFTQIENKITYQVTLSDSLIKESIRSIDINWGDSAVVETWTRDSATSIEGYLKAEHYYTKSDFVRLAIKLSLIDGTESEGFRNAYIPKDVISPQDESPDSFAFLPITEAPLNTQITSNEIIVSGINTDVKITIENGEYSIDSNAFTAEQGIVTSGQEVKIQLYSAENHETSKQAQLTIGDMTAAFKVTTLAKTIEIDTSNEGGSSGGAMSLFELLILFGMLGLFSLSGNRYRRSEYSTSHCG
jgi:Zn-dependent metalloprotease